MFTETILESKTILIHCIVAFSVELAQLGSCFSLMGSRFQSDVNDDSKSSIVSTFRRIKNLVPFLWPKGWYLRGLVMACYGLLILGRFVNVMVPLSYKHVIDDLTVGSVFPLASLTLYTLYRFLQGIIVLELRYFTLIKCTNC